MALERKRSLTKFVVEEIGKIKFDRTPTSLASDQDYLAELPRIRELYGNVSHWHGTGRYKFDREGNTEDILAGILRDGELKPHDDDWDRKRGKIQSVSLGNARMYARLYAGMFCPAGTRIQNELGSRELWGYYFLGTSAVKGLFEYRPDLRAIRRGDDSMSFIPQFSNKSREWTMKVSVQEHNIKDIFLYGTDIAENYPILIGIKTGTVSVADSSKFINLHESRTEEPVPVASFSHVEVPLARVGETREVLSQFDQDIEILPIEYGEEYCRNFTFRQLSSGKPLVP